MKFKKILMIGFEKENIIENEWKRIKELCEELIILPKESTELDKELINADCLLVKLGATVDKSTIDKASNLKYIGMFGTGYGRIDIDSATNKGITVCNIAGYSTNGVAELALGLILEYIRDISRGKIQANEGNYSEDSFKGTEIFGKKFGIIGMGRIGTRIAEIASKGFDADVMYWSRNRKKNQENSKVIFQENLISLMKENDFISINLSFVKETEKFINKELINSIKPGAVIINLSPMELFDMDALKKRLELGDITFILDHSDELAEKDAHELAKYKNCIMYPPIGYITAEATMAKQAMFVDNLQNYLNNTQSNKVN